MSTKKDNIIDLAPRDEWTGATKSTKAKVWDKTNGICIYCGNKLLPFINFQVEHLFPRSYGGSEKTANLFPVCKDCNYCRKNLPLKRFREILTFRSLDFNSENEVDIITSLY